jgi:gas vesicle protein
MTRNNGSNHNEEQYSHPQEPRGSSNLVPFALGAIVGGVIGASLALLYAPAEGSELRRGMSDTLDGLAESTKDMFREAKASAEKLFRDVVDVEEERAPTISGRMRERADDIMEDADRAIAEARRRVSNPSRYDEDED